MSLRQVIWSSHSKNELTRTLRFWSTKNQSESYNKRLIRSIDRYLGFIQNIPQPRVRFNLGLTEFKFFDFSFIIATQTQPLRSSILRMLAANTIYRTHRNPRPNPCPTFGS